MPETTEAAPSLPDLIPAPRKPEEPGAGSPRADAPEGVHASATRVPDAPGPFGVTGPPGADAADQAAGAGLVAGTDLVAGTGAAARSTRVTDDHDRPAGERLAFLWTALGALVGSAVVAGLFLAFLALLP